MYLWLVLSCAMNREERHNIVIQTVVSFPCKQVVSGYDSVNLNPYQIWTALMISLPTTFIS